MKDFVPFHGATTSWSLEAEVLEIRLHREPCNEIGTATLEDWERLVDLLPQGFASGQVRAALVFSERPAGFCAGADLRQLFAEMAPLDTGTRRLRIREFLRRIHRVMNSIDESPIPFVGALHGVTFGGGFELALTLDLLVADRSTRFAFPELRLGLIPGFGGVPRLKRDLGNARVRDLLLTGRTLGAERAQEAGLVAQVCAPGRALEAARLAAKQLAKYDRVALATMKRFVKPIPREEFELEIELFTDLFLRPVVEESLRAFVSRTDPLPYLPSES